jgi:hypothetical protein
MVATVFLMAGAAKLSAGAATTGTAIQYYHIDVKFVKTADHDNKDCPFNIVRDTVAVNHKNVSVLMTEKNFDGALSFDLSNIQFMGWQDEEKTEYAMIFVATQVPSAWVKTNLEGLDHEWISVNESIGESVFFQNEELKLQLANKENADVYIRLTSWINVNLRFTSEPTAATWTMFRHLYDVYLELKPHQFIPTVFYEYFYTDNILSANSSEIVFNVAMHGSFVEKHGINANWKTIAPHFVIAGGTWHNASARIHSNIADPIPPKMQEVEVSINNTTATATAFNAVRTAIVAKQDIIVVGGVFAGTNVTKNVVSMTDTSIVFKAEVAEATVLSTLTSIRLLNDTTLATYDLGITVSMPTADDNSGLATWQIVVAIAGGVLVLVVIAGVVTALKGNRRRR